MLIYPMNENFKARLPVFTYESGLELYVVPFDLIREELMY